MDDFVVLDPSLICSPTTTDDEAIYFSTDVDIISARYAYTRSNRMFKMGTTIASSFSTSFIVNIDRASEDQPSSELKSFRWQLPTTSSLAMPDLRASAFNPRTGKPLSSMSPKGLSSESTSGNGHQQLEVRQKRLLVERQQIHQPKGRLTHQL
ncbi:hypothetical protein Mapa_002414 [Marchantia paleacea]|nr:hypothetical protein Mapa_002414 [Marchantia paleacea]